MDDKEEAWFQALTPAQQKLSKTLRQMILTADDRIIEEIKWNQPCYSRNNLFCYLQKAAKHVTIGFQQGAHLSDPSSLLEGDGKHMRHVNIGLSDQIDQPAIGELIEQALAFDKQ